MFALYCVCFDISFAINNAYEEGGEGAIDLANKVVEVCNKENDFKLLYNELGCSF